MSLVMKQTTSIRWAGRLAALACGLTTASKNIKPLNVSCDPTQELHQFRAA